MVVDGVRTQVEGLARRMATGETWLRQNPKHVRYAAPVGSEALKDCYRALTQRGQAALELYQALVLAHECGKRVLGLDEEFEQARKRRDDEAGATLVKEITGAWQDWERATEALTGAESKAR